MTTTPLSYTVAGAAAATGLSVSAIRALIQAGDLPARYYGHGQRKTPLIGADDLMSWFRSLPDEPQRKA